MKIKHWQGYGCVNAKKISMTTNSDGKTVLKVQVTGNHEYGIETDDDYTVNNWLIKRFDKTANNPRHIDIHTQTSFQNGVEVCDYTITY